LQCTPANQIIMAASIRPSQNQNRQISIRSHSRGPLGTILTAHSWELNTLTSPASPAGPCWFLLSHCYLGVHSRGPLSVQIGLHGLFLVRSSRGLASTDSCYNSHLVPVARCNYHRLLLHGNMERSGLLLLFLYAFTSLVDHPFDSDSHGLSIHSLFTWLVVHSIGLPRTIDSYCSSGPLGIHHTAAHSFISHGPCCSLQLPRTLVVSLLIHSSRGARSTTTDY
jgi:hypothetical protein